MTTRYDSAFPRRNAPEFCVNHPPEHQRAQGMPGAGCARRLACEIKKHTSVVTTVTPDSPGIPYAMVLTVSFVLSPVIGLSCHRDGQIVPRALNAGVDASGPRAFAVRKGALSSAAPPASTASRSSRP